MMEEFYWEIHHFVFYHNLHVSPSHENDTNRNTSYRSLRKLTCFSVFNGISATIKIKGIKG